MAFTGIEHLADRRISRLSGGERQMAYIAMAVCREPEVLVLDEPTASLDYAHQVSVMDLMEKMKTERKVTVIMVSHDINLAAMYGDRLLLVKDGRKLCVGKAADVISGNILEEAYNCNLVFDKSPVGDFPRVIPLPGRYKP
jgi:iron complex transport system ATP-binding protein